MLITLNLPGNSDSNMGKHHINVSTIMQDRWINQPGWQMPENLQQKISGSKVLSTDVIHHQLKPPSRRTVIPPGRESGKDSMEHVLPSQPLLPSSNLRYSTERMKQSLSKNSVSNTAFVQYSMNKHQEDSWEWGGMALGG